jgi:hypothetical protein
VFGLLLGGTALGPHVPVIHAQGDLDAFMRQVVARLTTEEAAA